ncbi:hypothetical protein [Ovoidimarina sediminis]|uniref:hypothetical protein n=1 Tax=Ovoidimarina sediminis TaxID=3079856 RepID=UPI00290EC03B|nr:hypothetical protein [Rhodophyticola sp. MJ-SS7]MDU8943236.1 hypothetical protein [Rhodophyticola sp. MJ-SS7]
MTDRLTETSRTTDTRRMKAILTLCAAVAFASAPFWTSGFGGFDPNRYPIPQIDPPVQPAGYAFSIWGPIYLWLIVSAGFGLFRRAEDANWDKVRVPLILSLVLGTPWISVAMVSPIWATVMIWGMLGGALLALARSPLGDHWWLRAPLALYAGWLTAASFVSLALLGAGYGVAMGATGWAWAALTLALATGLAVQRALPGAPLYGLALAWALLAVAVKNGAAAPGLTALAGIGVVASLAAAWMSWREDTETAR